ETGAPIRTGISRRRRVPWSRLTLRLPPLFDDLDALNRDDWGVRPAPVQAFLARHDDSMALPPPQVEIGRSRVKIIHGPAAVRVHDCELRRRLDTPRAFDHPFV